MGVTRISHCFDAAHFYSLPLPLICSKTCIMPVTTDTIVNRNAALHDIFHRMAACYRYLGPEQRFRAIAYEVAARTVSNLKADITVYASDIHALEQLKGIGESIGEKIIEYLETGRIKTYEQLKKKVPVDLLELMDISGFGPSTIRLLHDALGVNNREELVTAIAAGKLQGIKGLGAQKIENMKRGLKLYKEAHARMLLWDAIQTGQEILKAVRQLPEVEKAELAGSLRRGKETVGDIDIVVQADKKARNRLVARLVRLQLVARVSASGETRISMVLRNHVQVDIRIVEEKEFGAAMLYFTGSKEHNIKLRTLAVNKGCKLNEYGLFNIKSGAYIAGRTEEEIYRRLGLQFIAPELREEKGEIALAAAQRLPVLVSFNQVKGDLQMHSRWSDGEETIQQLTHYILNAFPHYEYIVITDHSASQRIAHGLQPEDFLKQFDEIDQVNALLGYDFIKKGVEVDILANGDLDLPDELLQQFDWVVASIHSGFTHNNTARLLKACEHPHVHCIGHPSGRLIGSREPYPVDWETLFSKAAATHTAMEINAQPARLDLRDDLVRMAVDKGIKLVISTDAHALSQYDFMQLGVAVARRAGCRKQDVLNTRHWEDIVQFKKDKLQAHTRSLCSSRNFRR